MKRNMRIKIKSLIIIISQSVKPNYYYFYSKLILYRNYSNDAEAPFKTFRRRALSQRGAGACTKSLRAKKGVIIFLLNTLPCFKKKQCAFLLFENPWLFNTEANTGFEIHPGIFHQGITILCSAVNKHLIYTIKMNCMCIFPQLF